jgi:hypothetical protein
VAENHGLLDDEMSDAAVEPIVDVGAADARVGDADENRVRVGLEARDGAIFEGDGVGRLEDKGEVLERGWALEVGRNGGIVAWVKAYLGFCGPIGHLD